VTDEVRYSPEHLWLRHDGERVTVGVTEQISRILTWVKAVELPAPGTHLAAGEELAMIESQKADISIAAPAALEVLAVNDLLATEPMLVRMEPRGRGWLLAASLESDAWRQLLEPAEYDGVLQTKA